MEIAQPVRLRDEAVLERLGSVRCDLMLVVAYGLILPQAVLDLPAKGCINVHASLLPRWRGAAPIQRAIEAGDPETGITIMQMDAGLDSGPMLLAERLAIGSEETGGGLQNRLAALGARLAVQALDGLARGELVARSQPVEGITYARKIERADAVIDWHAPARRIVDQIRAFDPVPGCVTALASEPGESLKVWRARVQVADESPVAAAPGAVLASPSGALHVACGGGVIEILEIQRAGGKRQTVADFLRGRPVGPTERFVPPGA